jgi:isoquinoline 1-oxidoreductase alpha subunit
MINLHVNGKMETVDVDSDTPLLWVLRDTLGITSVKYTCGIGECGVCTVLIDGAATRSCSITAEAAAGTKILTIEGIPDNHPVKQAWIEKQVPQCGYCQPGIMLQTIDFLARTPMPSDAQIDKALDDVICRCGSHPRIKQAVKSAAAMASSRRG